MDQEDDMSSITKQADGSTGGHQVNSGNTVTTIAQIDPIAVGEARSITNITSSNVGAQQLSAGDLEALANIQEELDRIAQVPNSIASQPGTQDDEQGVVGVQEGLTGTYSYKLIAHSTTGNGIFQNSFVLSILFFIRRGF